MISIPLINAFDPDDRGDVRRVFADAPQLAFGQSWSGALEKGFRPGGASFGWRDDCLWVFAALEDDDIFNPVVEDVAPAFLSGDCFELFARAAGREAYEECHVTPGNARLHLRYQGREQAEAVRARFREQVADPLAPVRVQPPCFQSRAFVDREGGRWEVLLGVGFELLCGDRGTPGVIECSCGRYDYTRGADAPVISSTSLHPLPDFHRAEEWTRMAIVR